MDKQQNIEARPGDAERPQESGAASPGRGGRMSRQRKTAAVLRLLRGEDLETVSRGLGVTAATLSGWRDAFLAAGEAALATKSATGEELESDRLKAKLGAALIERDLLHEKIAVPTALCRDGRSGHEQDGFAGNRQTLWAGGGLPCLAHCPLWRLPPAHSVLGTATAWTDGRVVGCRVGRSDQGRARRQPAPWRGPSQGVGAVALRRHTDLVAPGASPDARARPAGAWPGRLTARPTQPRWHHRSRNHRHHVGHRPYHHLHR